MKAHVLIVLCSVAISACSREDVLKTSTHAGASYNTSNRDAIIKNWQAKVFEKPECTQFLERFKAAGEKYDNAANGSFQTDMQKVWMDTKLAKCGVA